MLVRQLCNKIEETSHSTHGSRMLMSAITDLEIPQDVIVDNGVAATISNHLIQRDRKGPGASSEGSRDPVSEALSILGQLRQSA